eukprot:UC4_evm1s686
MNGENRIKPYQMGELVVGADPDEYSSMMANVHTKDKMKNQKARFVGEECISENLVNDKPETTWENIFSVIEEDNVEDDKNLYYQEG